MFLFQLVVILIVLGLLLYVVESLLPIDPTIKLVIRVVILLAVVLWLLSLVGLIPPMRVGYFRGVLELAACGRVSSTA
jgi:hypothetical protein